MIELRGVSKIFGQRWAVRDLDLTVPRGEIFGLLGHNGAGKSTSIGMMLGQVWPTAGELRICGHDITRDRAKALHRVGAIFETPVFYDYLSGWKNLEILSHYTAPTPAERIKKIVEWVGLTGRENDKVSKYSHGMRTRLALAQALLPDPELLILDEPSDGLDPEGIHEMRLTIQRLQKELGLTILLSSHLLNEVEQLCTRIAVVNQGRKVFEGTLAEAKQTKQWVRLHVGDFAKATASFQADKLITDTRNGALVALADGVKTDALVRRLVALDIPVFAISPEEETLESFYLNLMQDSRAAKPSTPA
ncbi:MAG: ABC transporter ATP-binding protein [Verrucomicrobia bacterium]|nr:ABC transporter ATP-binding protein [Verrucomicrobiota bacterium]NBU08663.1 ABC transporter ATP-binding protein [Pseudomonadota bacterium]NDA65466.1 ABC transporter ATP-binding protein [Verrucomicrobiota bacterium]NDB75517.1 ABC transporter ATP-binding protein [Verrucomicrobiota bacterium]NDD38281.1 ABC transporter ATP-binding protein [Verrucomicrobiota bacterium]